MDLRGFGEIYLRKIKSIDQVFNYLGDLDVECRPTQAWRGVRTCVCQHCLASGGGFVYLARNSIYSARRSS